MGWGPEQGFNDTALQQFPFGQTTMPIRPDFDDPSSEATEETVSQLEELGSRENTNDAESSTVENERRQGQVSAAQVRGTGGGAASLRRARERGEDPYDLSEFTNGGN